MPKDSLSRSEKRRRRERQAAKSASKKAARQAAKMPARQKQAAAKQNQAVKQQVPSMATQHDPFGETAAYIELSDSSSEASVPRAQDDGPGPSSRTWTWTDVNLPPQSQHHDNDYGSLARQAATTTTRAEQEAPRRTWTWTDVNLPPPSQHHDNDYGSLARQAATTADATTATTRSEPQQTSQTTLSTTRETRLFRHAEDLTLAELFPEQQTLQTRYFGLTDPRATIHCLTCGAKGHTPTTCPTRACAACGAVDTHFTHACPQRQKCKRCRKHGHTARSCPAAATVNPGSAGDPCDICGAVGHVEEECSRVWKTFVPSVENVRKISPDDLVVGCYHCGSSGHWGGDCPRLPLHERMLREGTNRVWTADYAAMFLDMPSGTLRGQNGIGAGRQGSGYGTHVGYMVGPGLESSGGSPAPRQSSPPHHGTHTGSAVAQSLDSAGSSRPAAAYNYQLAYLDDMR